MISVQDPTALLAGLPQTWRSGPNIHVPTHCLYPGGGQVVVVVRPGHDGMLVTDDRLGWTTLLSAGIEPIRKTVQHAGRGAAERLGVTFDSGRFLLDGVEPPEMASAILHVANASQAWVHDVLLAAPRRALDDLPRRAEVVAFTLFGRDRVRLHDRVAGSSTKSHDIAIVIPQAPDRLILIEPVANHPNAIASAYLKFNDIGRVHADWPREAIIEKPAEWRSEDIVLLSEAGTGVTDIDADPARLRDLARAA